MKKARHCCHEWPDMMHCWLAGKRVPFFFCGLQVCMNSGKVQLNSGILERRRSNWDNALHHFRMARQIDDTYCEPDYWIGATLLQQGSNVQLGLMVCLTACSHSLPLCTILPSLTLLCAFLLCL